VSYDGDGDRLIVFSSISRERDDRRQGIVGRFEVNATIAVNLNSRIRTDHYQTTKRVKPKRAGSQTVDQGKIESV